MTISFKSVDAGEKSLEEIQDMIGNIKENEIISIRFAEPIEMDSEGEIDEC